MNPTASYQLTIVIPIYNEEDNMNLLSSKLSDFMSHSLVHTCVLFVNDGSTDTSLKEIQDVCERYADFYYISLLENSGLSAALKAGIDVTESAYVGYMDADLQTDPEDFNLLLEYAPQYELVTGIRVNRKDSLSKKIQSKIANAFRRWIIHDNVQDTGCPLKILNTYYAKRIPFFTGMHRFLAALILLQHGRVKQIPVRHYPRNAGKSKYNLRNRLIAPFIDCFVYRWMKSRYICYRIDDNNIHINKSVR